MAEFITASGSYEGPYTNVTLDLVFQQLPEDLEEDPGGFLFVDSTTRTALEIRINSTTTHQGDVVLSQVAGTGSVKVWTAATGGEEITLPKTWAYGSSPAKVWVSLETEGDVMLQARASLYFSSPTIFGVTLTDKVKITSAKGIVTAVDFRGAPGGGPYHILHFDKLQDDGTPTGAIAYTAPHWLDVDLDGEATGTNERQLPVCYPSSWPSLGQNVSMCASVDVQFAASLTLPEPALIQIRGNIVSIGVTFTAKAANIRGNQMVYFLNVVTTAMPNTVEVYDPLVTYWEVSINGGAWFPVGSTRNQTYLTFKPSLEYGGGAGGGVSRRYHTAIHVGCVAAAGYGGSKWKDVLNLIWNNAFKLRSIRRMSDQKLLSYYGFTGSHVAENQATTSGTPSAMLASDFGHGSCAAWAGFFAAVLRGQGIDEELLPISISKNGHYPSPPYDKFLIKNYRKKGAANPALAGWQIMKLDAGPDGSGAIPDSVLQNGQATDDPGIPGQGNSPNPISEFSTHQLIKANDLYYDPSYGETFTSKADFHGSALAGMKYKIPHPTIPNTEIDVLRPLPEPPNPLAIVFSDD